uniref:Uncharacterized protein n=1 Tax=Pararge aegeria TaxID=116150 RepID=S4NUU7_9NEOP
MSSSNISSSSYAFKITFLFSPVHSLVGVSSSMCLVQITFSLTALDVCWSCILIFSFSILTINSFPSTTMFMFS